MVRAAYRALVLTLFLVSAALVLSGSAAVREVSRAPVKVLQLNLCGSGIAGCYTGRSVTEAATVIRAAAPDVVTLNEVCDGDVTRLERILADVHGGGVVSAFKAAPDRRLGGGDTRCTNGMAYGVGLLARTPATPGAAAVHGGIHPAQDVADPEIRVWLCLHAIGGFYACTTHLASTSSTVALAQCRYLLEIAVPELRTRYGYQPTVVAGDLNLRYGARPDVRPCVPSGYLRFGDAGVQHILATSDFVVSSSASIDMAGTTDHAGLLVTFTMSGV